MNYKAIIFDLEGTLADTNRECIRYMVGNAFKKFDMNLTNDEVDKFWFDHNREKYLSDLGIDIKSFWNVYRDFDKIDLRKKHLKLYGDVDIIPELKQDGYKIGIVTGSPTHVIALASEAMGRNNFDAIIRAQLTSGFKPKPHPESLERCLSIIHVANGDAVYLGNGQEDIDLARNARVHDILIDRGEHELIRETPSMKISSLYELRDLLGI